MSLEIDLRYCKKCLTTDLRPNASFNEQGVCIACVFSEKEEQVVTSLKLTMLRNKIKENIKKRKLLRKIGLQIGLLFQIVDDLIDYKGDSTIVGKPTKSDKKKGKATLVNLLGYSAA